MTRQGSLLYTIRVFDGSQMSSEFLQDNEIEFIESTVEVMVDKLHDLISKGQTADAEALAHRIKILQTNS